MNQDCGCNDYTESLWELLDAGRSESECQRLREHIQQCPECYAQLLTEEQVRELVRRCCCTPAPVELRQRISMQIRVTRISRRQ
ncbi:mycothiol system anti-sigma-R factor [Corynebacterium poyangense]|uniref:Mycothiol system anti-sigma-R factor n=1 Tax=Corynebacterium poyangense TaxID=2684405 RepID=A0A7H0SML2_9CORY|nr:mycothiol system anti-sigma-R factor [Corynebacterium poyangense]MBZ8176893.1 mycothiol system anti-sigma-R factor [Corynebacterium poyangense]QNQ89787.1 mycothiol system anti-sigma-R factor [Corynebacterium poyangense]